MQIYDELGQKSLDPKIISNIITNRKIEISQESFNQYSQNSPENPLPREDLNDSLSAGLQYYYEVLK